MDWDHLYTQFYSSKGFSIVACTAGLNICQLLLLLGAATSLLQAHKVLLVEETVDVVFPGTAVLCKIKSSSL